MLNLQNFSKLTKLCNYSWRCTAQLRKYSSNDDIDDIDILRKGTQNPPALCSGRKIEKDDSCCSKFVSGVCPLKNYDTCESTATKCCYPKWKCESKIVKRKKIPKEPCKSMWEGAPKVVCDVSERFDDTNYTISDKSKRIYRRTWKECDPHKMRKRKVCCWDSIGQPMLEKRIATDGKPITACEQKQPELLKVDLTDLQECMGRKIPSVGPCRKIRLPSCQTARPNVTCKKPRRCECLQRECAPYPSFSECVREALKKGHPIECNCLEEPVQCVVFHFEKIKNKYHLPPPVPAWPPERPK